MHTLLACMAVLAVLLVVASFSAYQSAEKREVAARAQTSTRAILSTSNALKVAALEAALGERGYVITNNRSFLRPYRLAQPVIEAESARLLRITRAVPDQFARAQTATAQLERLSTWQAEVIALMNRGDQRGAIALIQRGQGRQLIEAVISELDHIERRAEVSLVASTSSADYFTYNNEIFQYGLAVVGLLLLVAGSFATIAMRRAAEAEAVVRRELERRATTDELTGIANRRELLASLDRAISSARRNRRPLALALIDIDHFKRINDCHGHPAGDAVIRRIALLAVDVMRGQDTVGRLGGEEFAVVLPDCSIDDAIAACERLRAAVKETDLEMETGSEVYLTLSTGITIFDRNDSAEAMIARADAALYAAKNGGRDQIKLAA